VHAILLEWGRNGRGLRVAPLLSRDMSSFKALREEEMEEVVAVVANLL
jgi:hypothetical protein